MQLRDGRRISRVGEGVQYRFSIESALQLPDDSPGDLFVEGKAPQEVTIVSVEGLRIVLSVVEDLGAFVPRARLQSNVIHLLRRLVERIEEIGSDANPGGDRLLRIAPSRTIPGTVVESTLQGQDRAVAVALSFDTSFIWGPPGTGKTYTIGRIGEEIARSGRSMLLVSHTNTAVDQATLAIADALGPSLVDGSVIRVGDPLDQRLVEQPRLHARTHVEELSTELVARRDALADERRSLVDRLNAMTPLIELGDWAVHAADAVAGLRRMLEQLTLREATAGSAETNLSQLVSEKPERERALFQAEVAQKTLMGIPSLDEQLARRREEASQASQRLAQNTHQLREAEYLLAETSNTSGLLRRWRGLPRPTEQAAIVERCRNEAAIAEAASAEAAQRVSEAEGNLRDEIRSVEEFRVKFGADPSHVIEESSQFLSSLAALEKAAADLRRVADSERRQLKLLLAEKLTIIRDWRLISVHAEPETLEQTVAVIESAHATAATRVPTETLDRLKAEASSINDRIATVDRELREIESELQRVEEIVVARAQVVATTLTRAYLRPSILKRRFDSVILDEASMAPIPALWAAAALADRSVTAVGDFKQLPPIKHSTHVLAERWLGQDVFTVAGVRERFERSDPPPTFAVLTEQRRMHPDISLITNSLVYEGLLTDGPDVRSDAELLGWYAFDWGHDSPVLLVDTSNTHAWVTSVRGTARSSRLNFLSATISMDLAERLLRPDRLAPMRADRARIMIACPYRPHARLLNLLVRELGLSDEVVAGTTHSFQGSEAPVVIYDLVNDEPHWRVAMFNPEYDETTKRLLNVALTRARRRLVVVGDFDWIQRNARRAFLGKLVNFLRDRYPVVDALDVVPEGLASRAADHHRSTMGSDDVDESRRIYTQADFYPALLGDVSRAASCVIIYSPFITEDRLAIVGPHLQAAVERGAEVFVVTKTIGERSRRDQGAYRALERALGQWGAVVVHKRHMHEKLAIIDDDVIWLGSLNTLSFSSTQEIMERRKSRPVVAEYVRTLRMEEMLNLYRNDEARCPFCQGEVFPTEGKDDPFYWRCETDGCHTRSIDQEPPRDGVITCSNCGGSVHVGEWGDKPHWRCDSNPRHRQPIVRTHLRLPMVRGMIPKRDLERLDRQFGVRGSG